MAFDYPKTAATANRLLGQFGRTVTLSRPSTSAPTYDPATGISTPDTPATYAAAAVLLDYAQRDIDGTLVQQGDQRCLMSPSVAVAPTTSDDVVVGTVTYSVKRVVKVAPAGTPVLYDLQLRGV